jgi:hypothetical protein
VLSDGVEALRTFEMYAAFRVSTAAQSERRLATDLAWDPPTNADWDEATHVARGLKGRAEQLLIAVSSATLDAGLWREQRVVAAAANELIRLGEALLAYRERLSQLAPASDGTEAWDLLDRAWQRWDTSAAHWGVSRAEPVACLPS